ncbi:MAG: elongator complex protein 3 [Anaerolineaceae bacterium]
MEIKSWLNAREITEEKLAIAHRILEEVRQGKIAWESIRKHPLKEGGYVGKHVLVAAYRQLVAEGQMAADESLLAKIRTKPVRTLSGVTTVTVLTKPYPCPGKCIFCPTDERMPKSYLYGEPGAMRGLQNDFDPYLQVASRIESLEATGHPTDKIELLILGGSWTAYRRDYQEWFIRRCFDAMNGIDSTGLVEAQAYNEDALHRNVGLVIETRQDEINPEELAWLRQLGVTKVQMGAQSLDDEILRINRRGHTASDTLKATTMLRAAGFKIVLHWMPNLLGATPGSDKRDFQRLWEDGYAPDEIKIYPTQLLKTAELYEYWQRGEYEPYTMEELVRLIADLKVTIPPYCRVNRVIRDIPSTQVVAGNRRTSLRQDVLVEMTRRGTTCQCVRCREIRGQVVSSEELRFDDQVYHPSSAEEHFLSFLTPDDKIAGYLRLSLPSAESALDPVLFGDLNGAALIREVHVFGQSLAVGDAPGGATQHSGLGKKLLVEAERLAGENGFIRLAVIAAVGTRKYYQARGFERGQLYMVKSI